MFNVKQINNQNVYYSDFLENIEHFFTSRDLIVKKNVEIISKYLNIKPENLICPNQTHSGNIDIAKENKKEYKNTDALILDNKNLAIYLNFADCTPIILYDCKNHIAAIAHAGWRGTVQKIAQNTVLKMKKLYNSNPSYIIALIGPCISFENFETSKEIIEALQATISNKDGLFNATNADLKGINRRQLEECGIRKIDVCPYCTVSDNNKFFSYRKENGTALRHSALIRL